METPNAGLKSRKKFDRFAASAHDERGVAEEERNVGSELRGESVHRGRIERMAAEGIELHEGARRIGATSAESGTVRDGLL